MKPSFLRREIKTDAYAIDEKTLHQYYNTVQSDVHAEHLVDSAMSRRHAMALKAHRRDEGVGAGWMGVLMLGLVIAVAVWLLG
jgi:hypothetical protein